MYVFHTFVSEPTLSKGPPNRTLSGHSFARASPQGVRRESENICFRVPILMYNKNVSQGPLSDPIGAPISKICSRTGSEPTPAGTSFRNPFRRRWPGAHDDSSTFSTPRFHETVRKGVPGRPPPEPARDLKSLFSGVQNGVRKRSPKRISFFPGNLQQMVPNRPKRPMLHPGAPGSSKMAPKVTQGLQRDTKVTPRCQQKASLLQSEW